MSKAFTREDDAPEEPILSRPRPRLPSGVKNYLTEDGAHRLRKELEHLIEIERPKLAASHDVETVKRELKILDQRIALLALSLQSAEIVSLPSDNEKIVRFGATVVVRDKTKQETVYRIVGDDETNIDQGWVSWRSPIAKALLNSTVGKCVKLRFPDGEEELEILAVSYK